MASSTGSCLDPSTIGSSATIKRLLQHRRDIESDLDAAHQAYHKAKDALWQAKMEARRYKTPVPQSVINEFMKCESNIEKLKVESSVLSSFQRRPLQA